MCAHVYKPELTTPSPLAPGLRRRARRRRQQPTPLDLAAPPLSKVSGVSGLNLDDYCSLNTSLKTLTKCFAAMGSRKKAATPPLRDSRLTHLLGPVLGDDTALIHCLVYVPSRRALRNEAVSAISWASKATAARLKKGVYASGASKAMVSQLQGVVASLEEPNAEMSAEMELGGFWDIPRVKFALMDSNPGLCTSIRLTALRVPAATARRLDVLVSRHHPGSPPATSRLLSHRQQQHRPAPLPRRRQQLGLRRRRGRRWRGPVPRVAARTLLQAVHRHRRLSLLRCHRVGVPALRGRRR